MPRKARKRAHRQGTVYQRGPRNWGVSWRERGRRRYSGGYETRELAEQVRAKIVSDIAAGRAGLPEESKDVPILAALAEDWLDRRAKTHRAAKTDRYRWKNHLRAHFGQRRPGDVDVALLRSFVETKLSAGLSATTVGHCVRLLSSLFTDLVERELAPGNPIRALPRSVRRLYRSKHDPTSMRFLERLEDVRRVYQALPEPINVAFAVGAFGGLRTGEVLGLQWCDIDLGQRRIHARQQVQDGELVSLKDDDGRVVPVLDTLAPILAEWKERSGGEGQLFRPRVQGRGGRPGSPPTFIRPHTLYRHLKKVLVACKLPCLTWYCCTRHTFASLWVLGGGSIEKLSKIMGHSSIVVTERYAHLRPDLFPDSDYAHLRIDLGAEGPR